ncbi:MAG: YdcF family protein [Oscillatoriales cyanobacterium C42_A2020_001]|nr:YdcF family protein [Leptolyngbyaceae cyanobacterium C42_A2020_001]
MVVVKNLYPFLATTNPVKADILVVEGWLPDSAIEAAIAEFQQGEYQQIMVTGGPIPQGSYLLKYKTYAELAAATLLALGLDSAKVVTVPAPYVIKDRTFTAANALKQKLCDSISTVQAINLLTLSVHARRSQYVYQKALGPEVEVGVISINDPSYDSTRWWSSSSGFKWVMIEAISYLYIRLFNLDA